MMFWSQVLPCSAGLFEINRSFLARQHIAGSHKMTQRGPNITLRNHNSTRRPQLTAKKPSKLEAADPKNKFAEVELDLSRIGLSGTWPEEHWPK